MLDALKLLFVLTGASTYLGNKKSSALEFYFYSWHESFMESNPHLK